MCRLHDNVRHSASVYLDLMNMTPAIPYVIEISGEGKVCYPSIDFMELRARFKEVQQGHTYDRDPPGTVYIGSCYKVLS